MYRVLYTLKQLEDLPPGSRVRKIYMEDNVCFLAQKCDDGTWLRGGYVVEPHLLLKNGKFGTKPSILV